MDWGISLSVVAWPAFAVPLIIGLILLIRHGKSPLGRMAGLFTLKPLLATPLWISLFDELSHGHLPAALMALLSVIPAIILTILIVLPCRQAFAVDAKIAGVLVAGDALRWLNCFFFLLLNEATSPLMLLVSLPIGLILPTGYAIMALILVLQIGKRQPVAAPLAT